MKSIEEITELVKDMMDDGVLEMMEQMDAYERSDWSLPTKLKEKADSGYIRKTISPAPANALNTAVKVLAAEKPNIKFTPTGPGPEDKANASKIERGLWWELRNAAKRSPTLLIPDLVRSAIKYAEVACYVEYLPWSFDTYETMGKDSGRKQSILRQGKFIVTAYNPQNVFARYSRMGLEAVSLVQGMKGREIKDQWNDLVPDEVDPDEDYVQVDYTDYGERAVFVFEGKNLDGDKPITLLHDERQIPFLPWVVRMTGSGLEMDEQYRRKPFLESVYRARLWRTLNLVQTLFTSEVISYAAAPRGIVEGPNGDIVSVDYGDPNKPIRVPPGHKYTPIPPPQIDRALTEIFDRTKADLDAATAVQVLQNLNFPAGTAYATINAVLQTAIASLEPYKVLAELAIADVCERMLLWLDYADGTIKSYGTGRDDYGEFYEIKKEDFSTDAIYIDVELNASAPTDFMQRINAGALMLQMGYPKGRVFEDLNVADPEQAILERYYEDMLNNEVGLKIQQRQMEIMQALQQPPAPAGMQGAPAQPAFSNMSGQGFNPNQGGVSPQEGAPQFTREAMMGQDRSGLPIMEE